MTRDPWMGLCFDRKAGKAGEDCNDSPGAHHCRNPLHHRGKHRCFCGVAWKRERPGNLAEPRSPLTSWLGCAGITDPRFREDYDIIHERPERPSVADVMPLVWALYATEHGSCGGHLHIVLDDGNIEDSNIQFCLREAAKDDCEPCLVIGRLLEKMAKTQRRQVSRQVYDPPSPADQG